MTEFIIYDIQGDILFEQQLGKDRITAVNFFICCVPYITLLPS
jgi:hypothetical protein